ncbi:hypothetical protein [Winogradskyella sp.]
MKYLDNVSNEFNIGYNPDVTTPHGIICKCDNEGITRFMASAVRNIVAQCHVLGWTFFIAYVITPSNVNDCKRIEDTINEVVRINLINYVEAKLYTDNLIKRYNSKSK